MFEVEVGDIVVATNYGLVGEITKIDKQTFSWYYIDVAGLPYLLVTSFVELANKIEIHEYKLKKSNNYIKEC